MHIKAKKFTFARDIHDEKGFVWGAVLKCSQGYCWGRGEDSQRPDQASKLYRSPEAVEAGLYNDEGFGCDIGGQFRPRLRVSR